MKMLREGALKGLPAFLYDDDMYDPGEPDKGLLRGHVVLRVCNFIYATSMANNVNLQSFRHFFTGPVSAMSVGDRKSTKPPKAKIHGLTKPTPRTIAYSAVQV
jgi:hypothetical protein